MLDFIIIVIICYLIEELAEIKRIVSDNHKDSPIDEDNK